ncbi:hypothetical protein CRENBAI_001854, partial [Crenichthys baileyi]
MDWNQLHERVIPAPPRFSSDLTHPQPVERRNQHQIVFEDHLQGFAPVVYLGDRRLAPGSDTPTKQPEYSPRTEKEEMQDMRLHWASQPEETPHTLITPYSKLFPTLRVLNDNMKQ